MEETEQLKEQNARLVLALQHIRNTTLEEAAVVCERGSPDPAHAIRSLKDDMPCGASAGAAAGAWVEKAMAMRETGTGGRHVVRELAQASISGQSRGAVTDRPVGDDRVPVREAGPFCAGFGQVEGETPDAGSAAGLPAGWLPVMEELERAARKFPTWPTDPLHAVAVLGEEFGELTKAVLQTVYEPHKVQEGELRTEAIQTAAMALRFLASLDCYEFVPCPQHMQSSGSSVTGVQAAAQPHGKIFS